MSRWRNVVLSACAAVGSACTSAPTVQQALDDATARIVAQTAAERRQCYLASNTGRSGVVSRTDVTWELSMLGNAVHVEAQSSPRDPELEACYEALVERLDFPGGFPHSAVSLSIVEEPALPNAGADAAPDLLAPPLAHGFNDASR
jgi:hypothetical protein